MMFLFFYGIFFFNLGVMVGFFGNGFCEFFVGVEGILGVLFGIIIGFCGIGGSFLLGVICDFLLVILSGMVCFVFSEVMFCCVLV